MTFFTTEAQRPPLHSNLPKIRGATAKSKHALPKLVGCPSEPSQTRLTTQCHDQKADLDHHLESRGLVSGGRVGLLSPGTVPALPAVPSPCCLGTQEAPNQGDDSTPRFTPSTQSWRESSFQRGQTAFDSPQQEKALISGQLFEPLVLLHFAISRSWV